MALRVRAASRMAIARAYVMVAAVGALVLLLSSPRCSITPAAATATVSRDSGRSDSNAALPQRQAGWEGASVEPQGKGAGAVEHGVALHTMLRAVLAELGTAEGGASSRSSSSSSVTSRGAAAATILGLDVTTLEIVVAASVAGLVLCTVCGYGIALLLESASSVLACEQGANNHVVCVVRLFPWSQLLGMFCQLFVHNPTLFCWQCPRRW